MKIVTAIVSLSIAVFSSVPVSAQQTSAEARTYVSDNGAVSFTYPSILLVAEARENQHELYVFDYTLTDTNPIGYNFIQRTYHFLTVLDVSLLREVSDFAESPTAFLERAVRNARDISTVSLGGRDGARADLIDDGTTSAVSYVIELTESHYRHCDV